MHSMTGYGRSRQETDGRDMTIELKTVNHRFLDVNLRMPRGLLFLEDPLRKALAVRLNRGHVDLFLTYRNGREDARTVQLDLPLLNAYVSAYDRIASEIDASDDRSISQLAALPNVLTLAEAEDDQSAVSALCMDVLANALDALVAMRVEEGEALRTDIAARLGHLESLANEMSARAPEVVKAYQSRLEARLKELLDAPPDPQRVAQEVALMADRAAIDEELVRLSSHIAQMRGALSSDEPVGRKLDFLVQELNREVNTVGSKASDIALSTLVVEAKAEIEKIREQVQNIE